MAYDAARQRCVLYGGTQNLSSQLDETWEWDGTSWVQIAVPGPGARRSHNMVFANHLGATVLFGGWNGAHLGDTWQYDGSTWVLRALPQSPTARGVHGMAYDALRQEVVIFGGSAGNPGLTVGDTWIFDGANWVQRSPSSGPPARHHAAMCFVESAGKVSLFGGWAANASLDDTWEWDGVGWSQVATAVRPAARNWIETSYAYHATAQRALLFGGWNNTGTPLGDAWEFDGTNWTPSVSYVRSSANGRMYGLTPPMTWAQAEAVAVAEGGHLATVRNAGQHSWLASTFQQRNLWIGLSDAAIEGQWVWSSGEPVTYTNWCPGEPNNLGGAQDYANMNGCTGSASWDDGGVGYLPGIVELPGGQTATVAFVARPTAATPSAVTGVAAAPLPSGGVLAFGGTTVSGPQPNTYTLTGTSWTVHYPLFTPSPRVDGALLLDSARQNNLMFGGKNPVGAKLGDTWVWSGGQWSFLPTAVAPAPRSGHAMTFDPAQNLGLLFGGEDAQGNPLADFWSWNGTVWTQLTPASHPPARFAHGLAYDSLRNRVVLYGGADAAGNRDDVWEWDGAAWTDVTPAAGPGGAWSPGARRSFVMAYDARAERVVIHGGVTVAGCEADIWSWDGEEWTLHVPSGAAPTARGDHSMWFDAGSNELRLFAGGCGSVYSNELWTVTLPVTSRWAVYGQGCAGFSGVPQLAVRPGSEAVLGRTFVCDLTNVPTTIFNFAFGLYDLQRSSFMGQPIPVGLGFAGLPGCQSWTGGGWSFALPPMQVGVGTSLSVPLPNASALLGVSIYLQALVFDNSNGRWASVSNAVEARIGDR